jgi:hypothetical protein
MSTTKKSSGKSQAEKSHEGRKLLSIREAAWALGADQATVCRAIRRGLLPMVRRHDQTAVPAAAIARLCRTVPISEDAPRAARLTAGGGAA